MTCRTAATHTLKRHWGTGINEDNKGHVYVHMVMDDIVSRSVGGEIFLWYEVKDMDIWKKWG